MADRALEGLRVVDISQGIAGPYATKLLADSGAAVTKVEPPDGDVSRRLGPFPNAQADPELSGLYLFLNTGKHALTLDLSRDDGRAELKKHLGDADVFVCGERASTLRAWGLSYDDLKGEFPELIVAQVSPFGATGPYADYDGNNLTAMAMSTIMYGTGDPEREPLVTGGEPGEYIAGVHLWIGILAALELRARHGGGEHVDVSMADAVAAADEYNAAMYAFQGAVRRRYYSRHIFGYPNDIMACADGHVVVIPGANGFRSPLASPDTVSPMALLLENIDLDQDVLFKQMGERMVRWRDFEALIEPYLSTHGAMEIVQTAQALRLPFAFVPTASDLLQDEHLAARNFFETIETKAGTYTIPGQPFRMSETPLRTGAGPTAETASAARQATAPNDQRPTTNDQLPLSGLRVVDLAQVFAGPACTRILADLGADVIRFESANRMDVTRNLILTDNDGKDHHWLRASYFVVRNVNKREMVLDLTKEEGREIIRKLVAGADVVVESFTPRVMGNFGLGYEQLRQIKPDIIMCSLSGYGQDGPMRDFGAYGMGLEPASGISSITGYAGEGPMRSGLSFTDPYSGFVGAGAVLTALAYRNRTGRGQYIDLSEQEAAIPIMAAALLEYQMTGRLKERIGDRSEHAAPQGCYRCAGNDRWAVISCASDAEFERLAKAIGHAEWTFDERLRTLAGRQQHHDELDAAINAWTSQRDHYDVMHTLQAAGVKAAPVLDGKEALFDPQFKARGQFDVVDQPVLGKRPVQRHVAARFSRFEAKARRPAPLLGEHNEEVLHEIGYSDEDIARLKADKVIATEPDLPVPAQFVAAALKLPYERYIEHGILQALDPDYREQLGIAD